MKIDDAALESLTNNNPLGGRVRLVEPIVFAVCNTDGVQGLSWAEVEQCEVSKNKYHISANSFRSIFSEETIHVFNT